MQTDSNGLIQCVCAATTETPGDNMRSGGGTGNPQTPEEGLTDSNGNLLCKAYA